MRKIRLEAEELRVESFETEALPADAEGTVQAHQAALGGSSRPHYCFCTEQGPTCPICQ